MNKQTTLSPLPKDSSLGLPIITPMPNQNFEEEEDEMNEKVSSRSPTFIDEAI